MEKMKVSLKAARVNAGFTQDYVSKKLKKSKTTIVNWENGKTVIDADSFIQLSNLYKLPPEFIYLPKTST